MHNSNVETEWGREEENVEFHWNSFTDGYLIFLAVVVAAAAVVARSSRFPISRDF